MQLQVAATYQPSENEVWVDVRSTENDLLTVTVADELELVLLLEHKSEIGSVSYRPLTSVKAEALYLRPDRNYEIKFRNPSMTLGLHVEARAKFGAQTVIKRVQVGEALSSHGSMDLPDNAIYEHDVLEDLLTGGGNHTPIENVVVLAPELRDYVKTYDFTTAKAPEDYEGLVYLGGGNRLYIHSQTSQFELQTLDQAPWLLSAFCFMEEASENLLPNPWFENTVATGSGSQPVGYAADPGDSFFNQSVDFDYKVTAAAKIWTMRFMQSNLTANKAQVASLNPVAVTEGDTYTFSTYVRMRPMTRATRVETLKLTLKWMDGSILLSETTQNFLSQDFREMNLALVTDTAPLGATHVHPFLEISSLDGGDDLELSLLGMQLEVGNFATSRTKDLRQRDEVSVVEYNASNQKLRVEMVAGFASSDTHVLTEGPLEILFSNNQISVEIPSQGSVTAPISFAIGDLLDLTVEHQTGKRLAVYRDGQLLADTPLPSFIATAAPLTLLGVGFELLRLSVFSRRAD